MILLLVLSIFLFHRAIFTSTKKHCLRDITNSLHKLYPHDKFYGEEAE